MPARAIGILGMHRSGTSCLTGSMQQSGLQLGRHHTWNKYNQKGNRENQDFVDFHEELLRDNNASWDKPPSRLRVEGRHLLSAQWLVRDLQRTQQPWGFKDPRALLALPLWNAVLPDAHWVGIFRHPAAVSASLRRRDPRMSEDSCLALWQHYNHRLLAQWQRRPFPLLCFDWDSDRFHQRLNRISLQYGLKTLSQEDRFYEQDLQNFNSGAVATLPWQAQSLYDRLRRIADWGA